jgi:hypothetical protein
MVKDSPGSGTPDFSVGYRRTLFPMCRAIVPDVSILPFLKCRERVPDRAMVVPDVPKDPIGGAFAAVI